MAAVPYVSMVKIPENTNHTVTTLDAKKNKSTVTLDPKKKNVFPSTDFPCYGCTFENTKLADLEKHNHADHKGWSITCPICSNVFANQKLLNVHKKEWNHYS